MLSMFKKKPQIHEPVELQRAEALKHPMGTFAVSGEDCDEVSGGSGPFGHSFNNPIPVNSQLGTYKYLTKLRSASGRPVLFHRLGSMSSQVTKYSVDAYEVVDTDGQGWDVIFLDMYHPRRSNKAPTGYTLTPFNPRTGDQIVGLGVDVFCPNFPYDLPDAIFAHNGFESVSKLARDVVGVIKHLRPNAHQMKVDVLKSQLEAVSVWQPFEPSA